ncbi:sulfite exporter TauE/SafE family protein [Alteromonas sp. 1_MG-2023]|uniref:sulfite exporter TauE/SafE family protein n=1 Tax=Alteromonas sp. 1_MG-2023 TaxID=3062669 RepID=UPI0026E24D28|nr:sulfite exporter TauE/SafE family protein [Alteromonas sp. 1_MG-2023]MDO6566665.1 sulfite exporter TauE/SafE family protein [Alteromonas sp. 1_MG-2023]
MVDSFGILILAAFIAGVVRGYAGFGFAAIAIIGFNLVLAPQQSIPIVLGLDVICSLSLLSQALRQADFHTFKILIVGALLGIPIGLGLLVLIPGEVMKLLICTIILAFSILLFANVTVKNTNNNIVKSAFGVSSGIGTAAASVGGPMIVCYMLSSRLSPSQQRATMILFFVVSETLALGAIASSGLLELSMLKTLLVVLLPTLIAVRIGQWFFNKKPPKSLKHFALPIMLLVALLGLSASLKAIF